MFLFKCLVKEVEYEANDLVINHIQEASKVDNKLEEIRVTATSTVLSKTIDD